MNTLKTLLDGALGMKVPAEFAAENYDYNSALRDEIKKIAGNYSLYRRNKLDLFDLLAEDLDEVLPAKVEAAIGVFAEVRNVPQGNRCEFRIKRGKLRGKQFVTRATASGVYETFRLDNDVFSVKPIAYGGAGIVDFERFLDGTEDIADIYEVIVDGLVECVYREIQNELLASWNAAGRPAANKVAVSAFDVNAMRKLCNTVAAYGKPVIYCSPEFASEMLNVVTYNTEIKISEQDALELRERGYIGVFYGTPVIVMPQSFEDEANSKTVMNPCFAYVVPAGQEKIVKVVMEGSSFFKDVTNEDNSMEIQAYKKFGSAIVSTPNYWGIYYNAGIDANGWADYNTAMNIQIS